MSTQPNAATHPKHGAEFMHNLHKLNGWFKVIATIVAVAIAWATMSAKLDGMVNDTAEIKSDIKELSSDVGDLTERMSRVEGRLEGP